MDPGGHRSLDLRRPSAERSVFGRRRYGIIRDEGDHAPVLAMSVVERSSIHARPDL